MPGVEFKIREVKSDWLEKVLLSNGAVKFFDDEVFTTYYDRSSDKFLKSGRRLTVSKHGDLGTISLKDGSAVNGGEELELEVSDAIQMDKLITKLGFTPFKVFKKHRKQYKSGEVIITFDKYCEELEYIPEFMIIEAETEEKAYDWAEKLGYTSKSLTVTTVLELIRYYKKLSEQVEKSVLSA